MRPVVTTASERFGRRLKRIREQEGETRQQLADICGVDDTAVLRWENGEGGPRADAMLKLCTHYRRHVTALLFGDKLEPEPKPMPTETFQKFLETQDGRMAAAAGLASVLASVQFKKPPSVRVYCDLARVLLQDAISARDEQDDTD